MTLTAPASAPTAAVGGTIGADIAAQLASGSWVPGGADAFHVAFAEPGGATVRFVSWALEYVHPLDQWLNALTGDTAQVAAFAQTWSGAVSTLRGARGEVAAARDRTLGQQGRTARAVRKRLDDLDGALGDAGDWAAAAAASLALASTIVTAVHDAIVGALSELAGLVVDLFGFTLDPFDKVDELRALVHRAQELIRVVAQLIERMTRALQQLKALLEALQPVIGALLEQLRPTLAAIVRGLGGVGGAVLGSELGPLGVLGGGYLGAILGGGAADLVEPDRRVVELDPALLGTPQQRAAYAAAADVTELSSFSDVVRQNGYVDQIGASDRSVVDITQLRSADGQTRYLVALPSTEDWDFPGRTDKGALNDLDTNVALVTMDGVARTQYERAVMQAMSDAGVPPGAHVVYTGFSQGGIMAAAIAEHDRTYATDAIITNGAPIGGFDIPSSTRVLSFEHAADPVPMLDGERTDASEPNRTDVMLPNPPEGWGPLSTHNNLHYTQSVQTWEAANPGVAADVRAMVTGTVVDRQFHTFHE